MSTVRITHIVPLHDAIVLAIFENQSLDKRTVKILTDIHGVFRSTKSEADIGISWPDENNDSEKEPSGNKVDVVIEIEKRLLCDVQRWCSNCRVTVEQLIMAFLRFCACQENYEAVRDWLTKRKDGNE